MELPSSLFVGVWRLLTLRYSARTNQLVILLCISLKDVSPELWAEESEKLVNMVQNIHFGDVAVTGLCVQVYDGLSVPAADHPVQVLFGTVSGLWVMPRYDVDGAVGICDGTYE